jgi:hypothetical protein
VTAAEALRDIRGYAAAGRYAVSAHARKRMRERSVREGDLRNALVNAGACVEQADGTWKVSGEDLDGDELTVVVAIEDGLVVVTLF